MDLQPVLQIALYMVFIPALAGTTLLTLFRLQKSGRVKFLLNRSATIERVAIYLLHFTTILLIISQFMLVYLMVVVDTSFMIVISSSAEWMSIGYRIAASWANRWGSYHLWTLFTWLMLSFFLIKYYKQDEGKKHVLLFEIFAWSSLLILFLLMGQRPYRVAELGSVAFGINPSLISYWNLIHPPIAFASYTGYFISWVVSSYFWLTARDDEFSKKILGFDMIINRITYVLTSLVLGFGMLWTHEANWGGYWDWDSIQVLALVLWLISAYRSHIGFKGKNKPLYLFTGMIGFTIVFLAAWIITTNILGGLHAYANSPIGPLFIFLTVLTLLPLTYGRRMGWKVSSPVIMRDDTEKPSGLNLGYISFNFLIMSNLVVIFLQLFMIIIENEFDFSVVFPLVNGVGMAGMIVGLLADTVQNRRISNRSIIITIVVATIIFLITIPEFFEFEIFFIIRTILIFMSFLALISALVTIISSKIKGGVLNLPKNINHIAMLLIFIVVIANGAGPSEQTREEVILRVDDTYTSEKFELDIVFLGAISTDNDRGTIISVNFKLEFGGNTENISIQIIFQQGFPPFIQANWTTVSGNLELFMTLFQSQPLNYFGPTVESANLVIEFYYYQFSMWMGVILFMTVPFLRPIEKLISKNKI